MWSKRSLRWLIPLLVLLLLAAVCCYLLLEYQIPWLQAENTMDPNSPVSIYTQQDGTLKVQWQPGENADRHTLQVLQPTADGYRLLYAYTTQGDCVCVLPQLPYQELVLQIQSAHVFRDETRPGEQMVQVSFNPQMPAISQLQWQADPDREILTGSFVMGQQETCQVYRQRGDEPQQPVIQLSQGQFSFGYSHEIPEHGIVDSYSFAVTRSYGNVTHYGLQTEGFSVNREDFLGTTLQLDCQALSQNAYELSWNETKGQQYQLEVSLDQGATWQLLTTVDRTGQRSFTTEHLFPFTDYQFRVQALDAAQAVTPGQCTITTGERSLYATIWPLMDLEVTAGGQVIGTAKAGTAYCVIAEENGQFGIRFGNQTGYIDSNYCMINLPEYLGDLCAYQITNSYDSLYMIHDFAIRDVTGEVIEGYRQVRQPDGSYLAPLLYPTAKKLIPAAREALSMGYQLKLYDTFRPREATLSIYEKAEQILEELVPEKTASGDPVKDLDQLNYQPSADAESVEGTLMDGLTYHILMTDNQRYALSNFLAQGISNHNLGVAIDMTLQTIDGNELEMQTAIHDLSWFSEPKRNNQNADLLKQIMTKAGFGMISAEWWHFQDDAIKAQLNLKNLYSGVSGKCWMLDDTGWRYRNANGTYKTNCTATIDGVQYRFDASGYVE